MYFVVKSWPHVTGKRKWMTIVVNSIFMTSSNMALAAFLIPRLGEDVWFCHKIVMAFTICCFIDLTLDQFGGPVKMVEVRWSEGNRTEVFI